MHASMTFPVDGEAYYIAFELNITGSLHLITCKMVRLHPCAMTGDKLIEHAVSRLIPHYDNYLKVNGIEKPTDRVVNYVEQIEYKPGVWSKGVLKAIFDQVIRLEHYETAAAIKKELSLLPYGPLARPQKWDKITPLNLMYINRKGKWVKMHD